MKSSIKNQKGALTLDFIFALVMVMGTTVVFGMFCFTMSLIETIQYTAYATSRGYFAGHVTQEKQRELAQGIYNELVEGKFKFFLSNKKGWFQITPTNKEAIWRDHGDAYSASAGEDIFEGTRFNVQAKILGFSVPFLGNTVRDNGYKTFVTSFLGREVTTKECLEMVRARGDLIKSLDESYQTAKNFKYESFDDNGC